ncbi:MAG: bacteriocin-protection protein, partial [Acidobacteria bacterium]
LFFRSQPESYRRVATWWVMSAKKAETRERRLATLVADSAAGRRVGVATPAQD